LLFYFTFKLNKSFEIVITNDRDLFVRTAWIFHEHIFEATESNLAVGGTKRKFISNLQGQIMR
jgi:hypothetical protein